jgi:acyl carrier protein
MVAIPPTGVTADEVLRELIEVLASVLGEEVVAVMDVSAESSFVRDLEMDSIAIVAFASEVNERFGERVDFIAWLRGQSLRSLQKLTVKDVADFIVQGR